MKSNRTRALSAALMGGVFGIVLAVGAGALADHPGKRGKRGMRFSPERMQEKLTEMTEQLDLTDEQSAQLGTIFEDASTRAEAIKEQPRSREKMEAFRELHFETEDAVYATLTCEQREGLRKLKRERRAERMDQRWQERHGSTTSEE